MVLSVKRGKVLEYITVVSIRQFDTGIVFKRDWKSDEEQLSFNDEELRYILIDGKVVFKKERFLLDSKVSKFEEVRKDCLVSCDFCKGKGKTEFLFKVKSCPVCKGLGAVLDEELFFERLKLLIDH